MEGQLRERVESMLARYSSWPTHFKRALERGLAESPRVEPRAIAICGMGTSASAGEHVAEVAAEAGSGVPLVIVRGHEPPSWLSREDLVVAVSYSGNTWETLECARRASATGASMAAVTSGGELYSMAARGGWPLVPLEPGEYGRTSMAYLLGALLGLLKEPLGTPRGLEELSQHILEAFRNSRPGEVEGLASAIARADFVAVAACGHLAPAARWWRTELAENTKLTARDDVYPESGHNDVVALQSKPSFKGLLLAIHDPSDGVCEAILSTAEPLYEAASYAVERLVLEGPSKAYRLGRSLILAGYASTLAAGMRGVDPHETPNLSLYKGGLRERLGGPPGGLNIP